MKTKSTTAKAARTNNLVAKHMYKTSVPKAERLRNKDLPCLGKVMDDAHREIHEEQLDMWEVYGE